MINIQEQKAQQLHKDENLSFEQALSELESIVKRIDTGQENLETAIASFERGIYLKSYCEAKLKEARLKIEKITKSVEAKSSNGAADGSDGELNKPRISKEEISFDQ